MLILLLLVLAVTCLYFGKSFLIPLALAAVLAMLFVKFSNWCEAKGLSRGFSAFLSVLLFVSSVAVLLLLLSWQLTDLTDHISEMKTRILSLLQNIRGWLNEKIGVSAEEQKAMLQSSGSASSSSGQLVFNFASGVMSVAVNTVLVLVYIFLFLYYRSHLKKFLIRIVPSSEEKTADEIVHEASEVSKQYLAGLALMIVMLWVMYGIGFSIVGVENAIFFAVLCGILEIVPFVGNITGTSVTVLAVVAQGGDGNMIIGVIITYLVVQFIQTYILEPLIVGSQVNINPLFTIIGIVAGEMVWGIAGMILAIPLMGIVKVICDHVPSLKDFGFLIGSPSKDKDYVFIEKLKKLFSKG